MCVFPTVNSVMTDDGTTHDTKGPSKDVEEQRHWGPVASCMEGL